MPRRKAYTTTEKSKKKWSPPKKSRRVLKIWRKRLAKLVKNKKLADKKKNNETVAVKCVTRTVEIVSNKQVESRDEKYKLSFMLALGLVPKIPQSKESEEKVELTPNVKVERLDPHVIDQVKAVTKSRIFELVENMFQKQIQCPPAPASLTVHESGHLTYLQRLQLHLLPDVEEPRVSPENVEIIDLASDDDEYLHTGKSTSQGSKTNGIDEFKKGESVPKRRSQKRNSKSNCKASSRKNTTGSWMVANET